LEIAQEPMSLNDILSTSTGTERLDGIQTLAFWAAHLSPEKVFEVIAFFYIF